MCRVTNRAMIVSIALALAPPAWASPGDERVTRFLAEAGMTRLLEVQLFDRLEREDDARTRAALASRLASLYLGVLRDEDAPEADRARALAKGEVLTRMMARDRLLELRLELAAAEFADHERAAELARIGLISDQRRAAAVAAISAIDRRLVAIAEAARAEEQRLERIVNRARDDRRQDLRDALTKHRRVHSRARFLSGWSGYALGVLEGRRIPDPILTRFGWVLGTDGSLPVLEEVDAALYEYDHVARSAVGVAQSLLHNDAPGRARAWLRSVIESAEASGPIRELARRRRIEASAVERDWIESDRLASESRQAGEMRVPTARILVIEALTALGSSRTGRGGAEDARQVARDTLSWLVDEGEIGHVTELTSRFDALDLIPSGFLRHYAGGLDAYERAQAESSPGLYAEARDAFETALEADDAPSFERYHTDAALKLALSALRAETPERARVSLEARLPGIDDPDDREQALWLLILATDGVRERAEPVDKAAFADRLSGLIDAYLREHPGSARATKLALRYAHSGVAERGAILDALTIEDPGDPLALRARRTLVTLLAHRDGSGASLDDLLAHARWIWEHESASAADAREARRRLDVCRVVLAEGVRADDPDHGLLLDVADRARGIIEDHADLEGSSGEIALMRIRLLADRGDPLDAARVFDAYQSAFSATQRRHARLIVFAGAWDAFDETRDPRAARIIVRTGRELLGSLDPDDDGTLETRETEIAERVVVAAHALSGSEDGAAYADLALRVGLRVFEEGDPSVRGLAVIARVTQDAGRVETALSCWLELVSALPPGDPRWPRARYESLRLMHGLNPDRWRAVMDQYRVLHPDGIGPPWDERIDAIGGGP